MNNSTLIELQDISFKYPNGHQAITDLSLKIPRGKKLCFLGRNGAGKSSLFLILNGINKPNKGLYIYNNQEVAWSKLSISELKRNVGIVFQEPDYQLFAPTVYEELSFGLLNLKLPISEIRQRIEQVMVQFSIADLQNKAPHLLSFGQKKRVAIASIVAMKPEVLILDEAFSGLDSENSNALISILNSLNNNGMTIIISTHDSDFAFEWSDEIVAINSGATIYSSDTVSFFSNTALLEEYGINQPSVVRIYNSIKHCLSQNTACPRNVCSLNQLILDIL